MEKRTAEIIMVCKGHHDFGEFPTFKQAVAAYMSDRCAYPAEKYSDGMINGIIWNAALDYMDSMTQRPSVFMRRVQEVMDLHNNPLVHNINRVDLYEAMCGAFQLSQVRDNGEYINGFSEENTKFVRKGCT